MEFPSERMIPMKKRYSLILTALLVSALLLNGCGSPDPTETSASPTEAVAAPSSEATVPAQAPSESAPATTEELTPVVLGTVNGNVYENEYVGFGCEFPENWTLAPAEVLQELPDAVADILADTDLDTSIPQIMDLYAQDPEQGTSVNVLYTEMPATERLAYLLLNDDQIIDSVLEQKDLLVDSYAQAGMETQSIEKDSASFLGQDRVVIRTTCRANGLDICIIQVFDYHLGGKYAVTTTFSGLSPEAVENTMAMFYTLN